MPAPVPFCMEPELVCLLGARGLGLVGGGAFSLCLYNIGLGVIKITIKGIRNFFDEIIRYLIYLINAT